MRENKKDSLNKKISIKNKKEAEKVLNKKKTNSNKTKEKKTSNTIKDKTKKTNNKVSTKKDTLKPKKIESTKIKNNKKPKKEEKTKLVLPKEWQVKSKNTASKKTKKQVIETPENLSDKLKNSIFEEVNEREIKKENKKNNNKKKYITIAIIIIMVLAVLVIFSKYSELMKKSLTFYTEYNIGEKITLKDNTAWYVVEYSDNTTSYVKLLKETQIDINKDGKLDANDKMKYNSSNKSIYDINDKESLAYYLENDYKNELSGKVGNIKSISILTSNEYIKARKAMGYGYEWTEGNWLASVSLNNWWISSAKEASVESSENKVYAVNKDGTYRLMKANAYNYVRPVITIE